MALTGAERQAAWRSRERIRKAPPVAKFDWYQATIEREPDWIRSALAEASQGEWIWTAPVMRSERTDTLVVDGVPRLELYQGGRYVHPHCKTTGDGSDQVASWIRDVCPGHFVSRADAAFDVVQPGWFDKAFGVMLDIGRDKGVKPERVGDWDSDETSRTFRLGSTSSPVLCRLYEKGMEQRAKNPQNAECYPTDWTRLEVQVRPAKRDDKMRCSKLPAAEFFGCSAWSQAVANTLIDPVIERHSIGTRRKPTDDLERREYFLLSQYAKTLRERLEICGSPEALGAYYIGLLDRVISETEKVSKN